MADGYNPRDTKVITVSIALSGQMSTVAPAAGMRLAGIEMPAAWTAGTLQMYISPLGTGADSIPVTDEFGTTKVVTVAASTYIQVPPDYMYSVRNLQVKSSVEQEAARTLKLHFREV